MNDTLKSMTDERAIELLRFAIKRSKDSMAALTHIVARLAQQPAAGVPGIAIDAREMLAQEYQRRGYEHQAFAVRKGGHSNDAEKLDVAIKAIEAAYNQGLAAHDSDAAGGKGGWQPIETAPKDGTYVLLFDAGYKDPYLLAAWEIIDERWWSKPTKSGASIVWGSATHWMPLPAAPSPQEAK